MSSWPIIKKEFRESKWIFIVGMIILIASGVISVLSFAMIKKLIESGSMPSNVPGMSSEYLKNAQDYAFYVWSSWFDKNYIQMITIFSVILGMGVIAGEVAKETISFLLTKTFSRLQVYAGKFIAGAVVLAIMCLISSIIVYFFAFIPGYRFELSLGRFLLGVISSVPGITMIFALAMLLSTIFADRLKAGLISGIIALGLAVPGFFPDYADYNVYKYFIGSQIFKGEGFPWLSFIAFVAVDIFIFMIGLQIFKRKQF